MQVPRILAFALCGILVALQMVKDGIGTKIKNEMESGWRVCIKLVFPLSCLCHNEPHQHLMLGLDCTIGIKKNNSSSFVVSIIEWRNNYFKIYIK